MDGRIRIVVVDDHSLFRAGVIQSLELDRTIEVVGEGSSAKDALELVRQFSPDLVLLDISMPGNGLEAAYEILKSPKAPQVAMLTVSEDDEDVRQALEAGAVGYLLKGIKAPDLITAVKLASAGEAYISPNLAGRLLSSRARKEMNPLADLTDQEKRTLQLVAKGLSNREIGTQMQLQEKTIKYHMTNILKKLGVRNRVEATVIARKEWGDEL